MPENADQSNSEYGHLYTVNLFLVVWKTDKKFIRPLLLLDASFHVTTQKQLLFARGSFSFNPFISMHLLYSLKTSENCKVSWYFQKLEIRLIGNERVNQNYRARRATYSLHRRFFRMKQVFYKTVLGDKFWSFIPTVSVCLFWRMLINFLFSQALDNFSSI